MLIASVVFISVLPHYWLATCHPVVLSIAFNRCMIPWGGNAGISRFPVFSWNSREHPEAHICIILWGYFFFLENSQDWKFRLEKYVYFKYWAKYYTQIVSNYCGILWVCLLPCTFAHRWCCFHMRKSGLVSWTYAAVLGVDSCLAAMNVSTNSFSACSVSYMLICFVFKMNWPLKIHPFKNKSLLSNTWRIKLKYVHVDR